MVTGIIVNKFPNLPSQYTSALRNALYIWEKHGYLVASETTIQHLHKRIYASGEAPKIENIIRGKLLYLRMIKGTSDPAYQRMAIAYNKLLAQKKHIDLSITSMKIDPIVATHQDAIRATWLIESMESTGTAFAIGNNLLLTCAHCVGDLKQKTVYEKVIANCSTYPPSDIRVKYIDWDRDIAVIELTQVNADHLMP